MAEATLGAVEIPAPVSDIETLPESTVGLKARSFSKAYAPTDKSFRLVTFVSDDGEVDITIPVTIDNGG